MYGGVGKHRRGGSGGGRKLGKTIPLHRPSSLASRPSGGPLSRAATPIASVPAASPIEAEESLSLVREKALNYGMIIRLAPDLVDEIRRAEEHGGAARIKFDAHANNPSGNVIDVGGKNFRFTWSREVGDLCDIYEERQSGEDGNKLLVESGCAWRKLNVQRVLDESTKNLVKKLSEEANRQQKSRKSIILDRGNPLMKNQMKAVSAADTTTRRKSFEKKKEPEFKKRKIDMPPVATAKSVHKSGLPSTSLTARSSVSPSPPQRSGPSASPVVTGTMTKSYTSAENPSSKQAIMKENIINSEKEKFNKPTRSRVQEKHGRNENFTVSSMDLQTMLITLLKENPKGMSLKALDKAVGDSIPNSLKKIEPIIKRIATYQAPGRYILKSELESGSLKKSLSESESSDHCKQRPVVEEKHEETTTPRPNFAQETSAMELKKAARLNPNREQKMNSFLNVNNLCHSPALFGEKKVENNEDSAYSSSGSDSESDSESDSGSDVSSNGKQGPDEDVDIMTSDDDNSNPKTHISEPKFAEPVRKGIEKEQDVNGSDIGEIQHDMAGDDVLQIQMALVNSDKNALTEHMVSDKILLMSKSKSKRGTDSKHLFLQKDGPDSVFQDKNFPNNENRPSTDEDIGSFLKYEKEVPELKEPIKDLSLYKEYVQEYQEKYDSYCSLNKALDSYRNEFYELGKDLENAKGRDVEKYYQILKKLYESYRQFGTRHKRMKKIFIVLHEELKHLKRGIQDFAASHARG